MRSVVAACKEAATSAGGHYSANGGHLDVALARLKPQQDWLVHRAADIVRTAFIAATATADPVRRDVSEWLA